ncbi:SDR family oxidoreductase [Nocardia sp. CDC159]|uniref:SDR family oxidoreductase n=1 Tax=Nocardia pulmonis TaxID=2951408 RepID=A0A9X2ED67_9NOCA|nr:MULTISPECIES: SDR family oxidoreductase [Nocardia]MCM6778294.1 SDR family oxidoreductase [Nocardia pulmonis]MCM6791183.1 SDR family oxidoreductase [Nocardia sp. CDC159]
MVALTGAGSGIGRGLAIELNRRGAHLALAGRHEENLRETQKLCVAPGDTEVFRVDVCDRAAVGAYAAATVERFGRCDVLLANAGILHVGSVESTSPADFDTVMGINFGGMVNSVKAFLPHLLTTGRPARIATVSSALGLVGAAEHAPYCASKFAMRGFTESLRAELARTNVAVTAVYPGGVRTPIARTALLAPDVDRTQVVTRFEERIARTDADKAAHTILTGVEQGRAQVLIGADARLAELAARLAGPHFGKIVSLASKLG